MNLDLMTVSRNTYNFFDLLSDVGGIQSIIVTFFNLLLSVLNYNKLDNYMVSKLYQYQDGGSEHNFRTTKTCNGREYLSDVLPCTFACCLS